MSEPTALSEQVLELEIRVAYQDRKVAALDEVVRTFTARVEELERQITEMKAAAKSPAEPIGPAQEPPPHY
ncbi:MAG: SlyX family protein [Kofleriaceae bacterium]|jgi:uncharacterized coiled-coil protein SlyX|nr:SlyX family protein [Kofleriaceae bacterium]MBP6838765.1 SlyX family protein [Kofleriaceae bacterium]MBP9206726.1 SlyX family protein [Kofleriaceae bacterium]